MCTVPRCTVFMSIFLEVQVLTLLRPNLCSVLPGHSRRYRHYIYLCQAAMEPRPCSPETAAFVASSLDAWNKFFSSEDSQSDSDSTRRSPTPSESDDHFSEDILNDAIVSAPRVPNVLPQLYGVYEGLTSFLGCSYDELLELVSCPCHYNRPIRIPYLTTRRTSPDWSP